MVLNTLNVMDIGSEINQKMDRIGTPTANQHVAPLFSLDKVQFPFQIDNIVTHAVSNYILILIVDVPAFNSSSFATDALSRNRAKAALSNSSSSSSYLNQRAAHLNSNSPNRKQFNQSSNSTLTRIYRIDLKSADSITEIELVLKRGSAVQNVYLDPLARHCIITSTVGDIYYLHHSWNKPRLLSKFKGVAVESLAWTTFIPSLHNSVDLSTFISDYPDSHRSNLHAKALADYDVNTGPILVGSKDGKIYELAISVSSELFKRDEKYMRLLASFDNIPIIGISIEPFMSTSNETKTNDLDHTNSVFKSTPVTVIFANKSHLYQISNYVYNFDDILKESPFKAIFHKNGQKNMTLFDVPGVFDESKFDIYVDRVDENELRVGWSTLAGVFTASCSLVLDENKKDSIKYPVLENVSIIPYPKRQVEQNDSQNLHQNLYNLNLTSIDDKEEIDINNPNQTNVNLDTDTLKSIGDIPLSIISTPLHYLVLYLANVSSIHSVTSEEDCTEEIALEFGEYIVSMTKDSVRSTYWVQTTLALYEVVIRDESRGVWKFYNDRKQFEKALKYSTSTEEHNTIYRTKAETLLAEKKYQEAAESFAYVKDIPFDEVVLKFMEVNDTNALRIFLINRLRLLKPQSEMNKTQITLLTTWLSELLSSSTSQSEDNLEKIKLRLQYLNGLILSKFTDLEGNSNTEVDSKKDPNYTGSFDDLIENIKEISDELNTLIVSRNSLLDSIKIQESIHTKLLKENKSFIENYYTIFDINTVNEILLSYGRVDEYIFLSELYGNYQDVIELFINKKSYLKVLEILVKYCSMKFSESNLIRLSGRDFFYKYSGILMENIPFETVNQLILLPLLNPAHLLSSFSKYDYKKSSFGKPGIEGTNQVLRYLKFVVFNQKNTDVKVHNYLITIYINASQPNNENDLLRFLESTKNYPHYEQGYALRKCMEKGLSLSCILLYTGMGLHEKAVEIALECNDLELAKISAKSVNSKKDRDLCKRLWLQIIKYLIDVKNDLNAAIGIIEESANGTISGITDIDYDDDNLDEDKSLIGTNSNVDYIIDIVDILPLFPDFTTINDLRSIILSSLEKQYSKIEKLSKTMKDVSNISTNLKHDIRKLKNRCLTIPSTYLCDECKDLVFLSSSNEENSTQGTFVAFPCTHAFHISCLKSLSSKHKSFNHNTFTRIEKKQQANEDKDVLFDECPYCGDFIIDQIDSGFLDFNSNIDQQMIDRFKI